MGAGCERGQKSEAGTSGLCVRSWGAALVRAGKPMLGSPQLWVSTGNSFSVSETESPGQGDATGSGTALVQEVANVCF